MLCASQYEKYTYLDLAYGGHRRYIRPPLSPSQPVIADGEIFFPGRSLVCFLVFLFSLFFTLYLFFVFEPAFAHTAKAQTKLR